MGGKKKAQKGLGQSVIRDRFQSRPHKTSSFLHTSELHDGYEWGRLNLQSVTEQSNLDDFLATAELADTQFTAEKLNVRIVSATRECVLMNAESRLKQTAAQQENMAMLKVPRRPPWNEQTTPDELDRLEREAFLEWRRQLNELQEKEHIILTPFEKNLEFWRQLWRVIERSDIVVQIVDARNPLLFRCEDLEKYVKEAGENKMNLILVNKADHLTERQRKYWYDYFVGLNVNVVFWSATLETERLKALEKVTSDEEGAELESEEESSSSDEESDDDADDEVSADGLRNKTESERLPGLESVPSPEVTDRLGRASLSDDTRRESSTASQDNSAWRVLDGLALVDIWKDLHKAEKVTEGVTTIGLVGYPNVGKSSTINAILKTKKVPVSATPGRTKHFQTLYLEDDVMLCDCPGLVMPSFVSTKADMVVSGILPIDQMRDYIPPVTLVCELIPRDILESCYGMNVAEPTEGQDPQRPPTAHELLTAYGLMRGYMTHKGVPDLPRSSRIILKDFVNGKLLYRYPPPGVTVDDYQPTSYPEMRKVKPSKEHGNRNITRGPVHSIDKVFFAKGQQQVHAKGAGSVHGPLSAPSNINGQDGSNAKPGKRHGNRGKKEKLRRTFAHLDQHWN